MRSFKKIINKVIVVSSLIVLTFGTCFSATFPLSAKLDDPIAQRIMKAIQNTKIWTFLVKIQSKHVQIGTTGQGPFISTANIAGEWNLELTFPDPKKSTGTFELKRLSRTTFTNLQKLTGNFEFFAVSTDNENENENEFILDLSFKSKTGNPFLRPFEGIGDHNILYRFDFGNLTAKAMPLRAAVFRIYDNGNFDPSGFFGREPIMTAELTYPKL